MNVATGDRWQFVQSVFSDQYRQIAHTPQNSIAGVVSSLWTKAEEWPRQAWIIFALRGWKVD